MWRARGGVSRALITCNGELKKEINIKFCVVFRLSCYDLLSGISPTYAWFSHLLVYSGLASEGGIQRQVGCKLFVAHRKDFDKRLARKHLQSEEYKYKYSEYL